MCWNELYENLNEVSWEEASNSCGCGCTDLCQESNRRAFREGYREGYNKGYQSGQYSCIGSIPMPIQNGTAGSCGCDN